jgi:hypothetical protein
MDMREWSKLTDTERREIILAEQCSVCKAKPDQPCRKALQYGTGEIMINVFHFQRVVRGRTKK